MNMEFPEKVTKIVPILCGRQANAQIHGTSLFVAGFMQIHRKPLSDIRPSGGWRGVQACNPGRGAAGFAIRNARQK